MPQAGTARLHTRLREPPSWLLRGRLAGSGEGGPVTSLLVLEHLLPAGRLHVSHLDPTAAVDGDLAKLARRPSLVGMGLGRQGAPQRRDPGAHAPITVLDG